MMAATGDSLEFGYDALKRLNRVTVKNGSSVILNTAYAYRDVSWNRGSAQVEFRNVRLGSDSGMLLEGKKYVYDDVGNLKEIRESTGKYNKLVEYAYDSQNQLTSEAYYKSGEAEAYITYNYTYDTAGNLLTVSQKKGNTTTLLQTYTYSDAQWHDLLTAVNGQAITYDASGNPLSYGGWSFGWQNGRQLKTASKTSDGKTETLEYSYDADGIRTSKTYTVETFTQIPDYTVTFKADGTTVKTMTVEDGYTLKDSDYPAVPEKAGYTGAWQRYTSPVQSNVTVSATYTKITTYYTVTFVADGFTVKTMQVYSGYKLKDSDYPSVPEKLRYEGTWQKYTAAITSNVTVQATYRKMLPLLVRFYADETLVKTMQVDYGYRLNDLDYPDVPPKTGFTGSWRKYTQRITSDQIIRANYTPIGIIDPVLPSTVDSEPTEEPWEPIEPNAAPAEEPDIEEQDLSQSDWTLASTETVTHEYLTQSGKVARETIRQSVGGTVLKTETLDFFYDESGRPFAFNYSVDGDIASTYYYILNLQGDVVQIIDEGGVLQAEYVYSPWGEVISAEGDLAEINPLRYRGYYYDSETGFYYLQSRYYDPENHRFINADSYASTGQGFLGVNMFAYCNNLPVILHDSNGEFPSLLIVIPIVIIAGLLGGCESEMEKKWPKEGHYKYKPRGSSSIDDNCYSYAFDYNGVCDPGDSSGVSSRLDDAGGEPHYNLGSIKEGVLADAAVRGKNVKYLPNEYINYKIPDGAYLIACKISSDATDYHFAVMLSDGIWIDKPGIGETRYGAIDGFANTWTIGDITYAGDTMYFLYTP